MENQFSRIGQLIYDLEAGTVMDTEGFVAFLDGEFREVTMQLGAHWVKCGPGLPYRLEFHAVECQRLLDKVKVLYQLFIHMNAFRDGKESMQGLYVHLIKSLNEQVERIAKMVAEPAGSALGAYHLN